MSEDIARGLSSKSSERYAQNVDSDFFKVGLLDVPVGIGDVADNRSSSTGASSLK